MRRPSPFSAFSSCERLRVSAAGPSRLGARGASMRAAAAGAGAAAGAACAADCEGTGRGFIRGSFAVPARCPGAEREGTVGEDMTAGADMVGGAAGLTAGRLASAPRSRNGRSACTRCAGRPSSEERLPGRPVCGAARGGAMLGAAMLGAVMLGAVALISRGRVGSRAGLTATGAATGGAAMVIIGANDAGAPRRDSSRRAPRGLASLRSCDSYRPGLAARH